MNVRGMCQWSSPKILRTARIRCKTNKKYRILTNILADGITVQRILWRLLVTRKCKNMWNTIVEYFSFMCYWYWHSEMWQGCMYNFCWEFFLWKWPWFHAHTTSKFQKVSDGLESTLDQVSSRIVVDIASWISLRKHYLTSSTKYYHRSIQFIFNLNYYVIFMVSWKSIFSFWFC